MLNRVSTTQAIDLNIVGSSVFGRYPKINAEKTQNMFISDGFLVDYAGYQLELNASQFDNAQEGRAIHVSTKLNKMVVVMDNRVYLVDLFFDQNNLHTFDSSIIRIGGQLQTSTGICYITENNKPQIVISDNQLIYYYDPKISNSLQIATSDGTNPISFIPGFIDFHDNYILCAASNDTFSADGEPLSNTYRLGIIKESTPPDPNDGKLIFPDDAASQGFIQTKPDNTKGILRFPSRGNMILVLGETVAEPWFDAGLQLFPYQRSTSFNIDYGCLNPATIARTDEVVCWLAANEKSGAIIMYSDGGAPKKITTDGIDYLFSQMQNPADSRAFMYRQDGHLFYHINFYTDNLSLFYDFNTGKFFHASDEKGNYFIADQVAFFNNQYYFISRNNGNLYGFDTVYTTYDGQEIPRMRICQPIRLKSQEYFIGTDIGFTIEQGETPYQRQETNDIFFITEDGYRLITEGNTINLVSEDDYYLESENDDFYVTEQSDPGEVDFLIDENREIINVLPRVELSISIDGAQSFSSFGEIECNPPGKRRSKLQWYSLGAANDLTAMFQFWGLGRFVATDGTVNIRQ